MRPRNTVRKFRLHRGRKAGTVKYRKKPVVVEARQFRQPVDIGELARWCGGEWRFEYSPTEHAPQIILIPTLEGTMTAHPGDWIIKGVKGEFYPCKPDIFEATYEPAGDSADG